MLLYVVITSNIHFVPVYLSCFAALLYAFGVPTVRAALSSACSALPSQKQRHGEPPSRYFHTQISSVAEHHRHLSVFYLFCFSHIFLFRLLPGWRFLGFHRNKCGAVPHRWRVTWVIVFLVFLYYHRASALLLAKIESCVEVRTIV